ncbi:AMP-dependent synthetase [Pseudaminobacter arsenicus]|uniref:AMP-dependent synthetase n=1 Tax=Borborobacter arsenicus TaxID=1851146 RepID=A0A432V5N2_9HYPH|nr:AMP-binding protein [Pseudaminobacter arsenicus]RUM97474.1 AMP-dependent synthetase [Pseudaminobacter arsenicus]
MQWVERFEGFNDQPALIFPGRTPISYSELARRVGALAQEFGPHKKLIAVVAEPTEHAVIAYLAALRGRHAVVLLPSCNPIALDDFIDDFSPDIVCRRIDGRWRCHAQTVKASVDLHPDLSVLLGTSGSTGKSRYVRLSHAAIEANAAAIGSYLGLDASDRAALILPFHYSYGLSVLNSHLAVGASIYFPASGAADAEFATEIRASGCSNISGVPYSFELMDRTGFRRHELPSLRFMTVAGGRMEPTLAETFRRYLADRGRRFYMMYGQTEATARIAYVPPEELAGNVGSIGVAIPGGSLRLVDEDGNPVEKPGQTGELVYRGPNVMMGYALAREDLAKGPEIAELHTGDMAERDSHGFYRIVGRRRRMSKIAGVRISHGAVEAGLEQAGISAAVTGDDERIFALVTSPHSDDQVLKVMMAASSLPRSHVELGRACALPRLASGKVDYAAVSARFKEIREPPNEGILSAYKRAFYPRQVGPGDTFEGLGGDSLLYVQLSVALERELGHVPDGWETMPVAALRKSKHENRAYSSIDSQLVLRAAAILFIVVHHATLWPIPGGAAVLVMLVGYGLARFQRQRLLAGDSAGVLRSLAANLAVYLPIVAGFSLARGEILWPSFLLVGNLGLVGSAHMMPYLYWFVEAYAQIVVLWVALFSISRVRDFARSQPFGFGLVLLTLAVAAKLLTPLVWNIGGAQIFTLPDVFHLAALGWCVCFASSRFERRILASIAIGLCAFLAWWGGNWVGSWMKFMLVLGAVLVLLHVPRIALPRWLARCVLPVSAASYHIYLFHRLIPEWLLPHPQAASATVTVLAIAVGVASGLAAFLAQKWLLGWLSRRTESGTETVRSQRGLRPT